MAEPVHLIVNADDYGYFPCVSRGIVAAANDGVVRATGILANIPDLDTHLSWLADTAKLDLGVHLCLTSGAPLSEGMRARVERFGGRFPRKERAVAALLTSAIRIEDVEEEWRQQIEICLSKGLELHFLNAHEHIHMWPPLFSLIHELAQRYGIRHVRFPQVEALHRWSVDAFARNLAIGTLARLNRGRHAEDRIPCVGIGESGNLTFDALAQLVSKLRPGTTYELMCHPGQYTPDEVADPRLRQLHNWEGELELLTGKATAELLARHNIQVVGYRDLPQEHGR